MGFPAGGRRAGKRCTLDRTGQAAALALAAGVLCAPAAAGAVPGPATVAVLSNANVPESVALGESYALGRQVPDGQVCAVDAPTEVTISLEDFRTRVLEPLETCLVDAGAVERIEAVVVARGMPLRVTVPTASGDRRVSLAAALGVWRSTTGGAPLLGEEPGVDASCGGGATCYAARWRNPFRNGVFEPGWTRSSGSVEWQPLLVTMLHGRTFEDAARLVTSALDAEERAGADGEHLFMNGADAARGVLDTEYDGVIAALAERGVTDVQRVAFDPDLTGHTLASFFTGTASLGTTIEGNTYHPGALVGNVTSFGAVPQNFEETGESQVSIARWVAMGVAGVHGTTDEPLNNCFPSRWLIVDYVDGGTLAEAYHRRLPFVYWQNLVLGDPMLAPYAVRPEVTVAGVTEGETLDAPRRITVQATDPEGIGVDSLVVYVDGTEVARSAGEDVEACLVIPEGDDVQVLAVAQKRDDGSDRGFHRPKGWTALRVASSGTTETECAASTPDGGIGGDAAVAPDAGGADAGTETREGSGGCGCSVPAAGPRGSAIAVLAAALFGLRRRRRGRSAPPDQGR